MAFDALPVQDYESACWWLLRKLPEDQLRDLLDEGKTPPLVAELVCDIHWLNPAKLRKDLRRKLKENGNA